MFYDVCCDRLPIAPLVPRPAARDEHTLAPREVSIVTAVTERA